MMSVEEAKDGETAEYELIYWPIIARGAYVVCALLILPLQCDLLHIACECVALIGDIAGVCWRVLQSD